MAGKSICILALASCLVAVTLGSNCYPVLESAPVPTYESVPACGAYPPVYQSAPVYNYQPTSQDIYSSPQTVVSQQVYPQNAPSLLSGSIDCGPAPKSERIKYLPSIVLPETNEPIRNLPSAPLPQPIVISNKCSCTKVVQKPQLYQRVIQTQRNQRFLKKTYVPRVEKVEYSAKPRC